MRPSQLVCWIALGALASATLAGCSREKDRWLNRTYHQTTARFNPLYNGQVAYDQAMLELRDAHRDDFTQLIAVDDWTRAKMNTPAYQKAKRSVEKASKAIREHSMVFKGKQANPAIFDAYLLMGRAQILMGLDAPASEALSTVARLSGRPEQQIEAELERIELLARQGNAALAEPLLFEVDRKGVPTKWDYQVSRIRARMAMAEQDWMAAAESMAKAAKEAPKSDLRARYAFLAAQLFEKASEPERARTQYETCLKAQPRDYAMLLEAQLRRSLNGGGVNPKKLYQELHQLLREPKNADFADRIYFSLGELAAQWDEPDRAYGYYQQSFAAGRAERPMVYGLAYARHGALALERRAYSRAQVDFDSAAIVLPTTYAGREGYQKKAKSLSVLVEALERAELGDSLVVLSRKGEADLRRQFEAYVAALKKADEAEAERERRLAQLAELRTTTSELDAAAPPPRGAARRRGAGDAPALRAKGAATFRQKFGDRPNVDNWRLRSKSNEWAQQTAEKQAKGPSAEPTKGGEAGSEGDSATATAAAGEPAGRYDVAGYLAKIPRNPEERAAVQTKACEAWSEVAAAYRDGMQDPSEAVTAYRRALRSCPDHPEASRWLYAVHRLHVALKENVQAEAALKELLERYPTSEAAQIVRKGSAGASKGAEPVATPAFIALSKAVDQRNWSEALRLYQTTVWTEPERAPAELLRALAVGGSQGRAAYADALRKVSAEFPSTPQAAAAQTYLVAISSMAAPEPTVNAENLKLFTPAPQAPHQVAILFPTGFDGNAVRNALARIHSTDFPDRPLGVRALPWNENAELLVVDGFKNAAEALAYRDAMRQNADLRKMLPAERTTFWPVTVANFSHLYRTKDEAAYRAFVQRNYGSP
ncbi:MAG: tetratricopeptide repeat protein [Schleiferiaceae bacterium]